MKEKFKKKMENFVGFFVSIPKHKFCPDI